MLVTDNAIQELSLPIVILIGLAKVFAQTIAQELYGILIGIINLVTPVVLKTHPGVFNEDLKNSSFGIFTCLEWHEPGSAL